MFTQKKSKWVCCLPGVGFKAVKREKIKQIKYKTKTIVLIYSVTNKKH